MDPYRQAADALERATTVVAVTGAGMSAESGIPTFRGADGIWKKYPPEQFATIDAFLDNPKRVWAFWVELAQTVGECRPNAGHAALAELEAKGKLAAIITQNVDNLHQDAGSRRVIEYHGNARELVCLECDRRYPLRVEDMTPEPPRCECGAILKPGVIMFGEAIPADAVVESTQIINHCDAVLIVGTSAQVYPAAGLPFAAKNRGAFIIEVNIEPTDFTARITDAFLQGPCAEVLPKLVALLGQ